MLIYVLFVIGFGLLIKGADLLVEGAASIARRFNISNIVIGLTIVAFGTSTPEFVVSVLAALNDKNDIAIGNILGSNIANILLILGITAVIYPVKALRNTVLKEIPLSMLAAIVLALLANDKLVDGAASSALTRIDGGVLLCFFAIFLYYIFSITHSVQDIPPIEASLQKKLTPLASVAYVLLGLLGLIIGGRWIVDGAVEIARLFALSESVIGLTVVALGTSLPELATSVVAAYKKQSDIAIGNVVGSNIFNIFWILGFSAVIKPLPFSVSSEVDLIMSAVAGLLLFVFMFTSKKHVLERWEGAFLVTTYIGYITYLVMNQ